MPWKSFTNTGQQKTFDGGTALAALGAMVPIYDVTLSATAASIDIQNIPQTYAHLRLVVHGRGDTASTETGTTIRFNNDSSSNYDWQRGNWQSTTGTGTETKATTSGNIGRIAAANSTAAYSGGAVCDIPSYTGTTFNKTYTSLSSSWQSSSTASQQQDSLAGQWRSTAAINRITVLPAAGNFITGTRVTLYGMGVLAPSSPGSVLPVTYGTSLPTRPLDGQEAVLTDSLTAGTYAWRFRYNASAVSAYKWDFIGGSSVMASAAGGALGSASTYVNSSGSLFTLPRAGDYEVRFGAGLFDAATAASEQMSATVRKAGVVLPSYLGRASVNNNFMGTTGNNVGADLSASVRILGASAAEVLSIWGYGLKSGSYCQNIWICVTPVRVS